MPSSLIIVALVVAWLVVLVPMIVRKRQEIARTADSALAARVVRSGDTEEAEEEEPVREAEDLAPDEDVVEEPEESFPEPLPEQHPAEPNRPYRPGRGGFDPEAAAVIARAKYAFRQRVVLAMIVGIIVTGVLAGVVFPILWWPHGALDVTLITYLGYLRRQVRIEQEIRERRLARMQAARRLRDHQRPYAAPPVEDEADDSTPAGRTLVSETPATPPVSVTHPGARIVDLDDEDPAFDELDQPGNLPYRRAAGE